MPKRIKGLKPLVICIPGVDGKDILGDLLTEYGSKFKAPVSHTTREPRIGEVESKDFYFVEPAEMARMEKSGELIETTTIKDSTCVDGDGSLPRALV